MINVPLAAYVPAAFVLVITPGATTAVVVRNALEGGWRAGLSTAGGAALGNATHATLAGLGLAVLFHQSPLATLTLRIGGGLYLGWLALGSLRRAVIGGPSLIERVGAPPDRVGLPAFRQGLTVNLLNPAIVTFYLAIVPSFLPANAGGDAFAVLAAIHIAMAFACHVIWTAAFDQLRHVITRPAPMRVLEALAGTTLLWLAVRTVVAWKA